ncbi:hypothetical protein [Thalassobacillus hwangdonensis]|uniref:Uncharacterized protein n=1 Tax=Thalassobacillus hwangdonensis TaxID=546108 RepID=A0ABW3KVK4_9BACI
MNQTVFSSILFLSIAVIWLLFAILFEQFRYMNIGLAVIFLFLGFSKWNTHKKGKDWMEE